MYCLRLFIVFFLQELHCLLTVIIVVRSLKSMCIRLDIVYMAIYVPIVMYGLRLFIVDLQELHCLLHACIIRVRVWYHITKFRYSTPSSNG